MIDILPSTWYILLSNFPMWKRKGVLNPTFNYTLSEKNGEKILLDEVKSVKHGLKKVLKVSIIKIKLTLPNLCGEAKAGLFFLPANGK